ncbi:transcriptional regulator, LacI family [Raineyella antarctica]|uniref:Transcriptional regulator, LacI family n=1 Tax=Raineyella antarctica TaxID=1577474 RepID=A0A1G6GIG9_9ACTN|nr:LacI family DNA-binding transcriptional regulator [Raineyella antarctica]SDB81802.1 transcriptional regulator, LacI family [Raineyella antarctica]
MATRHAVTIREVAQRAGVSVATTSRVLSGAGRTSPSSEQAVRKAAADLGFRVNAQARALRAQKTNTIGLLISDVRNPFFGELAHAIEQSALHAQYATLLGNANEDLAQQDRYVQTLRTLRVDGIILAPQDGGSSAVQDLIADGIPTVFVDRTVAGIDIPSVSSDPSVGIRQAVAHLSACGGRRIGYIAGPQSTSTGQERLACYRDAAARAGFDRSEELIHVGDFQQASGEEGAHRLLTMGVDALFASDSPMAMGALVACRERGLRPGVDVDLVGFDDIALFRYTDPPLTAVSQDIAGLGSTAFALLEEVIGGGSPASVRLPTALVVRRSTRLPAPSGPPAGH